MPTHRTRRHRRQRHRRRSLKNQPQRTLPIGQLQPGAYQPRHVFDKAAIDELAASIRERGILQPLLVRPLPNTKDLFEIIAGERRWRAAQQAGVHDVPVVVRELSTARRSNSVSSRMCSGRISPRWKKPKAIAD